MISTNSALILILLSSGYYAYARPCFNYPFSFVTRDEWRASPPRSVTKLTTPVPYVIIHHTYIPGACNTKTECISHMLSMQRTHQEDNGWADIGYNFAIGGDGSVYEGRGWEVVGAHVSGMNTQSIGIVLIGDFRSSPPLTLQLELTMRLIKMGVLLGYIEPNYKLAGHKQFTATECPGQALYNKIMHWDNFVANITKS